jgi:Protein of unknown function (DUF1593)
MIRALCAVVALALGLGAAGHAAAKPRLFVLTDIGNEPDDQMSLVRLLVYANEIDIEGLGVVTSTWKRDSIAPEIAHSVIGAYGEALPNLRLHASDWPEAGALAARVTSGVAGYGLAALSGAPLSEAARALIAAADAPDPRPLFVSVWGGANTLAQALAHVRATRSPEGLAAFVGKLRVYAISDQDDAGPWIRREFPGLFVIASPSTQDGADYARATWTGISGDVFYRNAAGADFTTVSNAWLDARVRAKGPLGAAYPRYMFIMEGDTPSFLGLIQNGLQSEDHPSWGGWGGRYVLRQPYGEPRAFWTQGGDSFPRVTSADSVNGAVSDQATIWRWREAFQNDFAARMDWSVKPFANANHAPVVVVNAEGGAAPIMLDAAVGQVLTLDARASRDPDGDRLSYRWFHYEEAGFEPHASLGAVRIERAQSAQARITPTATCRPDWLAQNSCPPRGVAHVILAVTDNGAPPLTRYRRIILNIAQ